MHRTGAFRPDGSSRLVEAVILEQQEDLALPLSRLERLEMALGNAPHPR